MERFLLLFLLITIEPALLSPNAFQRCCGPSQQIYDRHLSESTFHGDVEVPVKSDECTKPFVLFLRGGGTSAASDEASSPSASLHESSSEQGSGTQYGSPDYMSISSQDMNNRYMSRDSDRDTATNVDASSKENKDEDPAAAEKEAAAIERIRACAARAKEDKADAIDAYALLQELKDEGCPMTVSVYNEIILVCAAAANNSRAETLDGERIFDQIIEAGLTPNDATVRRGKSRKQKVFRPWQVEMFHSTS
jgi:hypothetical protein